MYPVWLPVFFLVFFNELEMGAGIVSAMALTQFHLVYWMRQDLNPQPFDHQSSLLTTRSDCRAKNYMS